jgi:hypothetical protein
MIAGDGIATVVEDQDLSPEVFRITQQGATILLQVDPEWQNGEFLLGGYYGEDLSENYSFEWHCSDKCNSLFFSNVPCCYP